ncbi:MAG: YciI family protein [Rhizobiaceae bacterium]|nr:YciI family protein [Rhizobiaceae bacterium]
MIYAILAYHQEDRIADMTSEDDAALMDKLLATHAKLDEDGRLGPAARLDFTGEAKTLRGLEPGQLLDGPFAETKEQLLGFYLYECASMEQAVEAAKALRKVNATAVYEIRPVKLLVPGQALG